MTRGCNYEGSHFGASYPDATCHEGYLWDLDSCVEPGGALTRGGDVACPRCNTLEYVDCWGPTFSGNAKQRRTARRIIQRKVLSWAAA